MKKFNLQLALLGLLLITASFTAVPSKEDLGETTEKEQLYTLQQDFLEQLRNNNFAAAQDFLHPEGVFYFTVGKVPVNDFSRDGLANYKGPIEGIVENNTMDEGAVQYTNGNYWLDFIAWNYTKEKMRLEEHYYDFAYGTSGNFDSDNFFACYDHWDKEDRTCPNHRITYTDHNTLEYYYTLMVEYVKVNGKWKIQAIGTMEWTP